MSEVYIPPERREAVLSIAVDFLIELVKVGGQFRAGRCVGNALPADARVARVGYGEHGDLNIVVSSASFAQVHDYERRPVLPTPIMASLAEAAELAREAREAADPYAMHDPDLLRRLADYLDPEGK